MEIRSKITMILHNYPKLLQEEGVICSHIRPTRTFLVRKNKPTQHFNDSRKGIEYYLKVLNQYGKHWKQFDQIDL